MRQQGFIDEPPDACGMHFEGLYFQPRIVFPTILLAILLQSAWLHLAISAKVACLSWRSSRIVSSELRASLPGHS